MGSLSCSMRVNARNPWQTISGRYSTQKTQTKVADGAVRAVKRRVAGNIHRRIQAANIPNRRRKKVRVSAGASCQRENLVF